MALQTYFKRTLPGNYVSEAELERIILSIGDEFEIRIVWNRDAAVMSATGAVLGALVGLFAPELFCFSTVAGTALAGVVGLFAPEQKSVFSTIAGAALGGVTGFAVAQGISLRDLWDRIKQELQELFFIVLNYLRGLNPDDILLAIIFIKNNFNFRAQLARSIIYFIAEQVGSQILSNLC